MQLGKHKYTFEETCDDYQGPGAEVATSHSIKEAINQKQREHSHSNIDVESYFHQNGKFPVSVQSLESDNSFSIHQHEFDYTEFCQPNTESNKLGNPRHPNTAIDIRLKVATT